MRKDTLFACGKTPFLRAEGSPIMGNPVEAVSKWPIFAMARLDPINGKKRKIRRIIMY
jgi:hypothetical protein